MLIQFFWSFIFGRRRNLVSITSLWIFFRMLAGGCSGGGLHFAYTAQSCSSCTGSVESVWVQTNRHTLDTSADFFFLGLFHLQQNSVTQKENFPILPNRSRLGRLPRNSGPGQTPRSLERRSQVPTGKTVLKSLQNHYRGKYHLLNYSYFVDFNSAVVYFLDNYPSRLKSNDL